MLTEVLSEITKNAEKSIISSVIASSALIKTESIKQKTKNGTSVIAKDTRKGTERVGYALEDSLKGQWVSQVQQILEENNRSMEQF
ncbi:hypothetical protein I6N95_13295 [Vagococcus sp. BWB3-3]|uniref:Uncharacterized protein n=1 Tax=Vagococcus allomyrinae TaxID=2794353 RepID=A0A940P6K2_9ENTE|nr:hypothetical protein [Vagococcus allomyrinae]MBP1041990.1 hypothetical protein [Vagococcus allomyrinae]